MEVKSSYKQTEVGGIPEEWDVKEFGEIALRRRERVNPRRIGTQRFCVELDHIEQGTGCLIGSTTADETSSLKSVFYEDDVLFGKLRAYLRKYWLADRNGVCSTEIWVLVANPRLVTPLFLFHMITIDQFIDAASMAYGTHMPRSDWNVVKNYKAAMPPLPEQRIIAEALGDVDALIGALDQLIAKKRDLKQAAMQQLLTGQTRLPGFSEEWKMKRLEDLLIYERPDRYIIQNTEYSPNSDMPVLTANKSFILGFTVESFGVFTAVPAIIFDDFTTDSKYVDFPFKVKSSAMKILKKRIKEVDLRFIFERMQLIQYPIGEHKRHYISEYQKIELPLPEFEEQTAIASVLSDIDAEIAALEQRLAKTRALKQGMMQELLTGRTRLI